MRVKIFLGSTTESVGLELSKFLEEKNVCIGNYQDLKLWKHGGVYQCALIYAEVVNGGSTD